MSVSYVKAAPAEISRIVNRIEDVIDGEQNVNVSIACVVVAIMAQKPDIDPEILPQIVKDVSEYLTAYLVQDEVKH